MKPIRVLIADQQELAVAGLQHLIGKEKQFEYVGQVKDKKTLESTLRKEPIDILVLDYAKLQNFSVSELEKTTEDYPHLKFFIITADQKYILQVLEYGVLAFLTKDCSKDEIMTAFNALAKGQKFFCDRVLDVLMQHKIHKPHQDSPSHELSEREEQIIRYIAKGMGTQQIASELNLSPHTINAHRKNILKKLDATSPVEMIVKAMSLKIIQID